MKVAIFGGSGFMGYDFFRLIEGEGSITPIVYTSGPQSLSNLARHDVDIRFVPTNELEQLELDDGVDAIVNFAHPFAKRFQMTVEEQVHAHAAFFGRARERNQRLSLIHISTMSVYEPFAPDRFFAEDSPLSPPEDDAYATGKVLFESLLRALPAAGDWQHILRPTVVYGPFCRPWTDGPLSAFHTGDVVYTDLGGRIQPILARDISRFVRARLTDFSPGIFNIAGPEAMSWHDYLAAYRAIVGDGDFVKAHPSPETGDSKPRSLPWYAKKSRVFLRDVVKNKNLKEMIAPVRAHSPEWLIKGVRTTLQTGESKKPPAPAFHEERPEPRPRVDTYARPFFSEDRLVDTSRIEGAFSGLELTPLAAATEELTKYFRYRFSDEIFV